MFLRLSCTQSLGKACVRHNIAWHLQTSLCLELDWHAILQYKSVFDLYKKNCVLCQTPYMAHICGVTVFLHKQKTNNLLNKWWRDEVVHHYIFNFGIWLISSRSIIYIHHRVNIRQYSNSSKLSGEKLLVWYNNLCL